MNRIFVLLAAIILALSGWWFFSTERAGATASDRAARRAAEETMPSELEAVEAPAFSERVSTQVEAQPAASTRDATSVPNTEEESPRARARLTIVAAETGKPLVGFLLTVDTQSAVEELATDAHGVVELVLGFQRGLLQFDHLVDSSHERFREPWEFVQDSLLVDVEAGGVFEGTLRARPPAARIQVHVVRASGAPAVHATVQLAQGTFIDGVTRWHRRRFDETDDEGIARFYLHHERDLDDSFVVALREPVEGEVSDVISIGPPLEEGPHRLVLYPGSELDVLVTDEDEQPLSGIQVRTGSYHPTRRTHNPRVLTDAQGLARLAPLPAEKIVVYVRRPNTREYLAEREVIIERESAQRVHFVLPPELLVLNLHVSGSVLDAAGEPVPDKMLVISLDGAQPQRVFTEADGSFAYESTVRAEHVTVHSMTSVFEPVIEPETITVPAGTRDLEFRQHEDSGLAIVIFEVVDARTGAPLPDEDDVAIRVYLEPDERERIVATAAFGPDEGSTEVDFLPHDNLRWLVTAPGYRERRGDLARPQAGEDPPILRVEMERGFRRELVVHDEVTADALAGVAVLDDDGKRLATTGFDGHVVIEGNEWPEWLTLDLEGYEPLRWRARSHWFHYSDRFWMTPMLESHHGGTGRIINHGEHGEPRGGENTGGE
jgi:hypothetical protein